MRLSGRAYHFAGVNTVLLLRVARKLFQRQVSFDRDERDQHESEQTAKRSEMASDCLFVFQFDCIPVF